MSLSRLHRRFGKDYLKIMNSAHTQQKRTTEDRGFEPRRGVRFKGFLNCCTVVNNLMCV
jgi:hypothetical protein